jgi:hypothetical protein
MPQLSETDTVQRSWRTFKLHQRSQDCVSKVGKQVDEGSVSILWSSNLSKNPQPELAPENNSILPDPQKTSSSAHQAGKEELDNGSARPESTCEARRAPQASESNRTGPSKSRQMLILETRPACAKEDIDTVCIGHFWQ